ncbi:MAG: hypothetical protein DHS20C05_12120 [Hyphococcus sp.]|nr:MAG: hypothetical protein DHS20C05_12120 [Marinicaulis sp.]
MLAIIKLIRRMIEGSVSAIILIAIVAYFGWSDTINMLIADLSISSILFLTVLAIVLADLIAKIIQIFGRTFPDLIPKVEDDDLKRASLISRLRPGQTVALLSGAYAARVVMFVVIFGLLGASYAATSVEVQENLFGNYGAVEAGTAFLREGVAGSIGYFLFFIGSDNLAPIKEAIIAEQLVSASPDADVFLSGIRLYGLAFVLAILRTLVTPITFVRARIRARKIQDA